jgi:hypothetical protein
MGWGSAATFAAAAPAVGWTHSNVTIWCAEFAGTIRAADVGILTARTLRYRHGSPAAVIESGRIVNRRSTARQGCAGR